MNVTISKASHGSRQTTFNPMAAGVRAQQNSKAPKYSEALNRYEEAVDDFKSRDFVGEDGPKLSHRSDTDNRAGHVHIPGEGGLEPTDEGLLVKEFTPGCALPHLGIGIEAGKVQYNFNEASGTISVLEQTGARFSSSTDGLDEPGQLESYTIDMNTKEVRDYKSSSQPLSNDREGRVRKSIAVYPPNGMGLAISGGFGLAFALSNLPDVRV